MSSGSSGATLPTGQTFQDLVDLAELGNLSASFKWPYPPNWLPPALLDPDYVPPVRLKGVNSYSGTALLSINIILVGWKILTTQRTRRSTSKLLYLEDWLLLFALAGAISYMSVVWQMQKYQAGWHAYDVKYHSILQLYKLCGVNNLILIWIYCTSRASLLISFRRMYTPLQTRITMFIDLLAISKFFTLVICILVFVFAVPERPDAPFNLRVALQYGANILEVDVRLLAAQVSIDTFIFLIPLPLLWKLKNLPKRRMWQIRVLFGFGVCTMLAAYVRLGVVVELRDILLGDFPWHLPIIGISNNIETFFALVTACVPTANLFFKWAYNKPKIPALTTPRRKSGRIRKSRRKRDLNSTFDTVETTITEPDTIYDPEWSKGDTLRSDFSRSESTRRLTRASGRTTQDMSFADDSIIATRISEEDYKMDYSNAYSRQSAPPEVKVPTLSRTSVPIIQQTPAGAPTWTPTYAALAELDKELSHDPSSLPVPPPIPQSRKGSVTSNSARKSTVSLREVDEYGEDEDNFYEMLVPSDAFFPWGTTGLRPRPPAKDSSTSTSDSSGKHDYELQQV